jgi:hypothetical protein
MTQNTTPIPFGQAVPKPPLEPDRHELTAGLRIVITDILISTQTRYEKIAKINGLVNGAPMKYRTTSKTVVKDCEQILANIGLIDNHLKTPVDVLVKQITSGIGHKYLKLIDPSEA